MDASSLVAASGSTLTVDHTTFTSNQAIGGAGANGGVGGNSNGGAITNVGAGSTALVSHSDFTDNEARGGAGAVGGAGANGGTVSVDPVTISAGNHASDSDNEVFGILTDC